MNNATTHWECFCDKSYYDLWAVRPIGDRRCESQQLFHVQSEEEAEALVETLNKATQRQDELVDVFMFQAPIDVRDGVFKLQNSLILEKTPPARAILFEPVKAKAFLTRAKTFFSRTLCAM